jgi:hypothetical protein
VVKVRVVAVGAAFYIPLFVSCTIANELTLPGCVPKSVPAKPAGSDGPSIAEASYVVREVRIFGEPAPGLALDGSCDCLLKCVPVNRPSACPATPSPVDNAARGLFSDFKDKNPIGSSLKPADRSINEDAINAGLASVLVTVREYSGQPEDPLVRVRIASSLGTGGVKPKFDGTDTYADSDEAAEAEGYVSKGSVVASFPALRVRFKVDQDFRLLNLRFVGKLGAEGKLTEGVLAGIWPIQDALSNFDRVQLPIVGPICKNDTVRAAARPIACDRADLLAGMGPASSPCDAASFGLGFTFAGAKLGAKAPLPVDDTCKGVAAQACNP